MTKIFYMAFSLLGLFSCGTPYTDLDADAFQEAVDSQDAACLIDVRTADEYSAGHIERAANFDYYSESFVKEVEAAYDKSEPLYVYCRTGKRSAAASKALSESGYKVFNLVGGYVAWSEAGKRVTKYEVERFRTKGGEPVDITLIKHGSLAIYYKGVSIQVDPVAGLGKPTDYSAEFPSADVILVTHEHQDHLDAGAIEALSGDETRIILNNTSREKLGRGEPMANGERKVLPGDIILEAVPAYNTTPGREKFHPVGNGNGYILTIDGFRIYIAGDTEDIPEMDGFGNIDVAFLPVNQPYTMTVDQCVRATVMIKPKVLIPYHFGQTDISGLPGLLPGTEVRIRQMQ